MVQFLAAVHGTLSVAAIQTIPWEIHHMLRIIQAGMGGWGRDWAKSVIKKDDHVSLVACVDAEPSSLALARKELDLPSESYFTSLAAALEAVDAGAVLITANLPGH